MKPESELIRLDWLKPDETREWVDPAGSHLKTESELIRLGWFKPDEAREWIDPADWLKPDETREWVDPAGLVEARWNQRVSWSGWFTSEAREWVDRAGLVQAWWSQRVSWSGWFPLKSSPTCSSRWLHCYLQNVQREHANSTDGMSETSSWMKRISRIALLIPWGGPKCRNRLQQFLCYYDCWLPPQFCLSSCCFDTVLDNLWEVSMEGPHNINITGYKTAEARLRDCLNA
jgi:hypothetical protein